MCFSLGVVSRLLAAAASPVGEHGRWLHGALGAVVPRLGSCGALAPVLRGMCWDPPGSEIKAASPALAADSATVPPGEAPRQHFSYLYLHAVR